ncbi:MAG TPA: aminotransferase class III-fold pyridoxal phosphate-dependent enzyme [Spirochaetia bacterium]|nr:aminotransferase class III-fold pyridoxal phosphate-dependent enzyme [Spirochaetales bacterium]HRS65618.1 aminotransferase class III-fold pyridoxal phosphate-dependent enzyme [Spirochaetia bacterium]HRV28395.1 aminotransferase class III-fold pyridoxal phosphate-dependent enzyme [Spirochaetia bacterium]
MAREYPKLKLDKSLAMFEEAKRLSPGGIMGIRRPYNFVEGEYPIFLTHGYGGHIVDVDGNDYIDMLCAYGPIILGYNEPEINEVVKARIDKGFCFSLVQPVQNEFEQRIIDMVPCAEMVIPVKTGSDATSLAVRIARGYTDKSVILRCGYHGWHDWCVEVHGGVPEETLALTDEFEYGDIASLEEKLDAHKGKVACVIITPVGHPLAKPVQAPPPGYLEAVKELTHKHGAVLIFDEIRTGFRASLGGAQERYGVTPDLATFGKAVANGYPISLVAGKKEIMSVCEKKVFVSSTFFPNSIEMVAALKCTEILKREDVPNKIWERGTKFLAELEKIVNDLKAPVRVSGIPPMPFLTFEQAPGDPDKTYKLRREYFYTQTIRRGLFIQPFHHWYIAYRHTDEDLTRALTAIRESMELMLEKYPAKQ